MKQKQVVRAFPTDTWDKGEHTHIDFKCSSVEIYCKKSIICAICACATAKGGNGPHAASATDFIQQLIVPSTIRGSTAPSVEICAKPRSKLCATQSADGANPHFAPNIYT